MESYLLQISCRDSGSLLQNKSFVPIDGPFLSISNSSVYKSISFVRAAWSKSGTKIAACDCHGAVYLFDFLKSRFYLAHRFSICCTCMVFSSESEVIIALADCNIAVLNLEKKSIKNKFNFHSSCINSISFDKSGLKVLSASSNEAIVWNLASFNILKVLTLKKNVDIVKVFILPDKDIIVSSFKDSSVFLWDFKNFTCICQFLCSDGKKLMNLKTVDCSWDENLIACAGKTNWFIVWSIPEERRLYNISLPENISVKQLKFLYSTESFVGGDNYILALLTSESDICFYNLKDVELLHLIKNDDNKIISFANSPVNFRLFTICLQGNLDVYDVEPFLNISERKYPVPKSAESDTKSFPRVKLTTSKISGKKVKRQKKPSVEVSKESLKSMVKNFEEFPEKYRFFIWSQLLELPHNVDAFKVLHQDSLLIKPFVKDYSFMNPGTHKTFVRIMSMLACWLPVIKEIDYIQCVVFPFVKVLHKNTIMCFETLITYISSWCQNWFIFCPFPPFNILSVVESLLYHHDLELVYHFTKYHISPEIYAWSLLQTSFSEVFNKHQWFKVWDNIFSNPPSFLLYAVAAFNIVMRDTLLRCKTADQFKQCYRKHGISASLLMQKTYELQANSPPEIVHELIGQFASIPKGSYPSFIQLVEMKVDFQTHVQKKLLDQEIDYLKRNADVYEVKGNYLLELQKLQLMRRKLLLESTDIENSNELSALARKLDNIQKLVQENLTDQIAMLKTEVGYDFLRDTEDYHLQFFKLKDYIKRLRNEKR